MSKSITDTLSKADLAATAKTALDERDKLQSEIAALREKLAAAEQIGQKYEDRYFSERKNAEDFRATVAAALAELRAHWNAQYQHYVSMTDDSSWERRQELLTRMRELDATIAALGLAEKEQQ